MTAATPGQAACGCPETDGKIYHQRGTCTDPVVAKLDWYADSGRIAATPGQAARDLQAERDHAEWLGWMEARAYSTHPDDCEGMDEAFTAGMQAARDLAAAPGARPAPGSAGVLSVSRGDGTPGGGLMAYVRTEPKPDCDGSAEPQPAPGLADAMSALTTEMHAEADRIASPNCRRADATELARAQALHEYAARIRQALGPEAP